MNKKHLPSFTFRSSQSGFAMLYTVLIISLILSIALSISTISYKQGILSGMAKDSQIAFYQADAGMECALLHAINLNELPYTDAPSEVPQTLRCGTQTVNIDATASNAVSGHGYFIYTAPTTSAACFLITIDSRANNGDGINDVVVLESRGRNRCQANPRQIERAIRVQYN